MSNDDTSIEMRASAAGATVRALPPSPSPVRPSPA